MNKKCKVHLGFCSEHGWDCGDYELFQQEQDTVSVVLVEFVYQDGSNYKESRTLAFEGALTEELRERLRNALSDGEQYLPTQIGHEHLGARMTGWPNEDDHVWHEIDVDAIEQQDVSPDEYVVEKLSFAGFVQMMVENKREGWDVVAACEDLGLELEA